MDQKIRLYSCQRKTRRWPFALFLNLLDIAALNSYCVWTSDKYKGVCQRRERQRCDFIQRLALELVRPYAHRRLDNLAGKPTELQQFIRKVMGSDLESSSESESEDEAPPVKKRQCVYCKKEQRTTGRCSHCKRAVCKRHSTKGTFCKDYPDCGDDSDS